MPGETKRIEFIDCMRGLAMLLIVYGHVCYFNLSLDSSVNNIFVPIAVPLFFFISGFMMYTPKPYNEWIKKKTKKRILNQFLPSFTTGLLFALFISLDPVQGLFDRMKYGYWFTIVLFEIYLIYLFLKVCMDKLRMANTFRLIVLGTVIGLCILSWYLISLYTNLSVQPWYNLFSVEMIFRHTPFVFLGIICRMFSQQFKKIVHNKYVVILMVIAFLLGILGYIPSSLCIFYVTGVCGIGFVYHIFEYYEHTFSNQTLVGKGLSYIGEKTLPIYFLHFFVLKGINLQGGVLTSFLQNNWFFDLIVCSSISILIVMASLLFNKMIESVAVLHTFMFGPNLKKA